MICTSIKQSQHLLELGLSPDSADMCWSNRFVYWNSTPMIGVATEQNQLYTFKWCEMDVPAWSLSALLEVMPKDTNETYHLFSSMMADQLGSWVCDRSKYYMGADGHNKNDYECFKSDSPVTAAYEMVCWLLTNNLITNN